MKKSLVLFRRSRKVVVNSMNECTVVRVSNVSRSYDILIGSGILSEIGDRIKAVLPKVQKVAIITDDNVKKWYAAHCTDSLSKAGFETELLSVAPGEASKNGNQFLMLLEWLSEKRLTRTDVCVALGGGVVGDLAGFVAATYLRGIPFVQVPTTLLSMVDSSVGGKTAIDLPTGKNLAGAFYQPSLVLCDTVALSTLTDEVFFDGCAEVIKHGMLGSESLLESLSHGNFRSRSTEGVVAIIAENVSIKRDIVQKDEFDTGQRMILNFGHTVGHAIERLSCYKISHGNAVAVGMAVMTRAAVRMNFCSAECLETLESLLSLYKLPNKTNYTADELYKAALVDKKRAGDDITIIVPIAPGKCKLKKIPAKSLIDWIEMGLKQ